MEQLPQRESVPQIGVFHTPRLARIHRRYDVTAAEWVMRGKGRRWSGYDFGVNWAGVCLQSPQGDLVTVWGRWEKRDGGDTTQQETLAPGGASWRGRWVGRLMGQWRTGGVRPGVESLAAGRGRG